MQQHQQVCGRHTFCGISLVESALCSGVRNLRRGGRGLDAWGSNLDVRFGAKVIVETIHEPHRKVIVPLCNHPISTLPFSNPIVVNASWMSLE